MSADPVLPPDRLPLEGRHVVLGVTGSIAAYKAADLASKLVQAGALLEVVMTPAATQFVTPLTFQSLSRRDVVVDMFTAAEPEAHVEVARRADVMVIAPATADTLANLAQGRTPDMVALTALATAAPVVVAPAMDNQMWQHPATQANVALLRERGVVFAGPASGRLASGRSGAGRLLEPAAIVGAVRQALGAAGDLRGRHVIVSAGGTREPIDPVRYIGNRSSGKMGFAIAEAARDRGARVTLVTGPVSLETPYGIERCEIESVSDLLAAMQHLAPDSDAIVMAAAPGDFRAATRADQKIKKNESGGMDLSLTANPDVIASTEGGRVRVGFAAETEDLAANAARKIAPKRLDFIVGNDVTAAGSGFATDTNQVTIFYADGRAEPLPLLSKYAVGHAILDRVVALLERVKGEW